LIAGPLYLIVNRQHLIFFFTFHHLLSSSSSNLYQHFPDFFLKKPKFLFIIFSVVFPQIFFIICLLHKPRNSFTSKIDYRLKISIFSILLPQIFTNLLSSYANWKGCVRKRRKTREKLKMLNGWSFEKTRIERVILPQIFVKKNANWNCWSVEEKRECWFVDSVVLLLCCCCCGWCVVDDERILFCVVDLLMCCWNLFLFLIHDEYPKKEIKNEWIKN